MGTESHPELVGALEVQVAAMRRLGVTKWKDIELGPDPISLPQEDQAIKEEKIEDHPLLYAASGA